MDKSPLLEFFGDELREAREDAGLSLDQLASKLHVSKSLVGMVENYQRSPSQSFAKSVDDALGTSGRFERMRARLLRAEATPDWFRPWVDFEQQATTIRAFEPTVVPGLLQTEDYARTLTGSADAAAARVSRQQVLDQDSPPRLYYIVDESVLYRRVGSTDVMAQQLDRLTDPAIRLQVLPSDAESYLGVDGSFELAVVDDRECVYVDTPARGFVLEDEKTVAGIRNRWDILRGEALPLRQSRELITKVAQEWKTEA